MNDEIIVNIADAKVGYNSDILVTYALGSCVGICLLDVNSKIGGMVHVMLPYSKDVYNNENKYKFADTGIKELLQKMKLCGANKNFIIAKIAGGAKMFEGNSTLDIANIGKRNVESTKKILSNLNIPILAEDTGMNYGRTIRFYIKNGDLSVESVNKGKKVI